MSNPKPRLWGGILFVAGTSIGAGMLALPVVTAAYGFWPAISLFLGSWFFMLLAALFILEVNLWLPLEANIIAMANNTLGGLGEIVTWVFYLLLLYILMAAYLSGIDSMLETFFASFFHVHLSTHFGLLLLVFCSFFIVYLGIRAVDLLNRFFMFGLVVCYCLLVLFIAPHLQLGYLVPGSFRHVYWALPVVMSSFGFQIIVPTLRLYLNNDLGAIKRAIIVGSSIPLLIYLVWEALILGALPIQGPGGLLSILKSGQPAVDLAQALKQSFSNPLLASLATSFSFFAMTTSFMGVSLSLFDFLSDGFKGKRLLEGRFKAIVLTVLPPALFVTLYPGGFILALGYAGTCTAILLGILPVLMVWRGRYILKIPTRESYRVPGGWASLLFVLLCSVLVIVVELLKT